MSLRRIVFWRHGQTDLNIAQRIQGATDSPLNAVGMAQAQAAAVEIAKLQPTRIISSDLQRAADTARVVAEHLGIAVELDARLRERSYGEWEGKTAAEIRAQYPEQWENWRAGVDPVGLGVETKAECGKRVAAVVAAAAEKAEASPEPETLLLVSHGGAISAGVLTLLGQNPSQWAGVTGMDNCHWALLVPRAGGTPPWQIRSYNRFYAADPIQVIDLHGASTAKGQTAEAGHGK
ncbi:MAG: histidine phosphatase family protein [Trueperella sp.]|nr:histidine phosphatase family protein [Trueperella sp.]